VLTAKGKLVIYHFSLIDNAGMYFKYLTFLRKSEERDDRLHNKDYKLNETAQ